MVALVHKLVACHVLQFLYIHFHGRALAFPNGPFLLPNRLSFFFRDIFMTPCGVVPFRTDGHE